ncbi:MAG TPA: hypothetical protein VFU89_05840 [Rhabdochlamydiaceae bacterium]|nr:hypothetical protein [Rhabdochlamydiaceae bacterium]
MGLPEARTWLEKPVILIEKVMAKNRMAIYGTVAFAILAMIAWIYRSINHNYRLFNDPKSGAFFSYIHTDLTEELRKELDLTYDPLCIFLFKKDLQNRPILHLQKLCQAIQQHLSKTRDYRIMVKYIEGDPSNFDPKKLADSLSNTTDTGGVFRDYLGELTKNLVSRLPSCFTGQPQALIPSAVNNAPALVQIFKDLGRLMMYCYNSYEEAQTPEGKIFIGRLIGRNFDDALFSAILSLSAEDIDAPKELSFEAKVKIYSALVESRIDTGENVHWLKQTLQKIGTASNRLNSEEEIRQFMDSLGMTVEELPRAFTLWNKVHVRAIKQDPEKFIEKVLNCTLKKSTGIEPGQMFGPVLMIAKGMKEFCRPGRSDDSTQQQNHRWDKTIRHINYKAFSAKVQGSLLTPAFRQSIVENIIIDKECNPKIVLDVTALKEWILNPNTPDEKIRLFLKFATGATTLLPGQKLTILARDSKGIVPCASTCAYTLTFAKEYPDEFAHSTFDRDKKFIDIFVQEMERTVDQFDRK